MIDFDRVWQGQRNMDYGYDPEHEKVSRLRNQVGLVRQIGSLGGNGTSKFHFVNPKESNLAAVISACVLIIVYSMEPWICQQGICIFICKSGNCFVVASIFFGEIFSHFPLDKPAQL